MQSGARAETVGLDELLITVVVDNSTDGLSSIPAGIPQVSEFVHLLDGPRVGTHDGHDMVVVFDRLCLACHGFSVLASGRRGEDASTVLFRRRSIRRGVVGQPARLGIDLSRIAVLFVSHWHGDHTGGIPTVVGAIAEDATVPDSHHCSSTCTRTGPTSAES